MKYIHVRVWCTAYLWEIENIDRVDQSVNERISFFFFIVSLVFVHVEKYNLLHACALKLAMA